MKNQENKPAEEQEKLELIDKAMCKLVGAGSDLDSFTPCADACNEWRELCGGGSWDNCGYFADICNYTDI